MDEKILPNTGLKGSRMAKQVYEDIEKGNPDLVIRMLNQKMEDWNMSSIPLMAKKA